MSKDERSVQELFSNVIRCPICAGTKINREADGATDADFMCLGVVLAEVMDPMQMSAVLCTTHAVRLAHYYIAAANEIAKFSLEKSQSQTKPVETGPAVPSEEVVKESTSGSNSSTKKNLN